MGTASTAELERVAAPSPGRARGLQRERPLRPAGRPRATPRIERFLASNRLPTPFVVLDLDVVVERYRRLAAALPMASIHYAVKANPAHEILRLLVGMGSRFDVASPGEIDLCLQAGARPEDISYGNTVKKQRDIAEAFRRGIRLFAFDSAPELAKIAKSAPGSTAFCRVTTDGAGADWPLSRKFGCDPETAARLAVTASRAGLRVGFSFHVGSQQRDVHAWDPVLALVGRMFTDLRGHDVEPTLVNIGGGFPGQYLDRMAPVEEYGRAISQSLHRHLGPRLPAVIAEPGRYLVADAGVLQSEVVLVCRKSEEDRQRWVYLDIGMFGGLAEVMEEAIRYRIRTPHDGGPAGPVAIAGPTCDSADVLYERTDYRLPLALTAGDRVELMSTGAYTTTYSSVGFNGLAPLQAHYLPETTDAAA